ncbi:MAG TPA: cadmium-translocating P-type ATPase [Sutterella sp.]|nr:cadmium-translocating P-type ATPase [Sutterella sp.]
MASKILLQIDGMHCAACAARIQKMVSQLDCVKSISVSLAQNEGLLEVADDVKPQEALPQVIARIESLGFRATVGDAKSSLAHWNETLKKDEAHLIAVRRRLRMIVASGGLLLILHLTNILGFQTAYPVTKILFEGFLAAGILFLCREILVSGFKNLVYARPDMDSLVAIGSVTAFCYSIYALTLMVSGDARIHVNFETAGLLLTFISIGRYFEELSKKKARDAIGELITLNPTKARRMIKGTVTEVPVEALEIGDTVLVSENEYCPADGVILEGATEIETSLLTGESYPQNASVGDKVYAGSLNLTSSIAIKVTANQSDSLLSEIIASVREAQASKPQVAKLADTVSFYFIPTVIAAAFCAFIGWFFFSSIGFEQSLRIAVSVVVLSCPCAMGLATPISIMVAGRVAARCGFLIKNADTFEKALDIDVICLDKTGTLTTGTPSLEKVESPSLSTEEVIRIGTSLETRSKHPLSYALIAANSLPLYDANPKVVPQKGVTGVIEGKTYYLGNVSWMEELGINVPEDEIQGQKALYLGTVNKWIATLFFKETLREDAKAVLGNLRTLGIEPMLLSGDGEEAVKTVASELGISRFKAQMTPEGKLEAVKQLQATGHRVAMAGDGINDAPALAQADLSVAIINDTKLSTQASDAVLIGNGISGLLNIFRLSRATVRNIRENLFWAFIYNAIGIPVAMGVLHAFGGPFMNPVYAAAAMGMSSLCVVLNALRLNRFR